MARAKKPTYKQKKIMDKQGLIVKCWLVAKETDTELKLVSRANGKTRTIKKPLRRQPKRKQNVTY
ncbi:DUF6906 family protein [Anaerosporobacter faecicola]|uniref:DUF6906 family protein n=1 Tax=Anaerosporobacter faecicola TaxID=2718714 RepID=UPI0014393434|nr:hypothetical protein [Anaerosporobacter faecicola]